MREIGRKLQEITSRQDELVDQVLFSTPDREVSGEGYGSERPWKPFGYVRMADLDNLLNIIGGEHPQTIALVLSYLEPHMASRVLSRLLEDLQPDIVQRIATIDRTDPKVLELLERWIQERFRAMGAQEAVTAGGIERVVDILNVCSRSVEKHVIESMENTEPDLSEELKKRMFVFEDIVLLDDVAIRKVLEKASRDDLLKAVKAVSPDVADKVYDNLPKGDVESFKADVVKMGRVRLSDVEAAQQRIVSVIRRLEEEGGIIVARPDETVV
jgi:flagellar motor switch protein FliG